jgi:hypothetical protein
MATALQSHMWCQAPNRNNGLERDRRDDGESWWITRRSEVRGPMPSGCGVGGMWSRLADLGVTTDWRIDGLGW